MQTLQRESALEEVIAYHEETKHQLGRYARSLGYLKWEDQPNPFREFPGAPRVELPLTGQDEPLSFLELFSSRSRTAQVLTRRTLGVFFQFSLALSAWKETPSARWSLRINPSSGNLHPTEAYSLLPAIEGISSSCGAYHYLSRDHSLELRSRWDGAPTGGFYVAFTSIPWREAWKYGERAFRYCQHDLGHALAAISFSAATLGWKAQLQTVSAEYLDWLLGLKLGVLLGLSPGMSGVVDLNNQPQQIIPGVKW
jgi:SagB-type dehydrogenase family enzyme